MFESSESTAGPRVTSASTSVCSGEGIGQDVRRQDNGQILTSVSAGFQVVACKWGNEDTMSPYCVIY